ncbi:MAG: Uncharacterized protein FD135_3603 [Comamonadaceae bacterium]|nr:MAG: Uncharacterized protein FD135_3603 [Comamonadaceae bacterium]
MKARPKTSITPLESIEIGLEIIELKALVKHGEFMPRLETLGYSFSDARRFMAVARKFHGASNARLLEAVDTVSKLNELLTLEDDELDTLKAGGEVQGITLASIKFMTVLELRAAIRGVSVLRKVETLTLPESKMLQIHRLNTRNVQDVTDKRAAMTSEISKENQPFGDAVDQLENDYDAFFECVTQPDQNMAGLQFVNPMGTWRMACPHVNQGTRYANVTFRPAPARAGYRATTLEVSP